LDLDFLWWEFFRGPGVWLKLLHQVQSISNWLLYSWTATKV
jgi:hypothetical protein